MLPSNPRAGRSRSVARQEPTREPQSRSQSRPRERYPGRVEEDRERGSRGRTSESGSSRQVRSQRSVSSMPTTRARDPRPPPPVPRSEYGGGARSRNPAPPASARPLPSRDSDSSTSTSSMSSSGSSFLDRMRQRTPANASSQSSFELDPEPPKEGRGIERSRKAAENSAAVNSEQEPAPADLASYGYAFWNRVATVASEWAWSGSSNNTMNEVAPSSKDSDITRVLKEYHISKARDRSDLPDWLFDERERRVDTGRASASQRTRRDDVDYDERAEVDHAERSMRAPARGRGFRDIYESAPVRRNEEYSGQSARGSGSGSDGPAPSRVTNRLKALRDAKRQVAGRATEGEGEAKPSMGRGLNGSGSADGYDRRYDGYDERSRLSGRARRDGVSVDMGREPEQRMPTARVGLPTNPRRR